jgi:hypothetical protein
MTTPRPFTRRDAPFGEPVLVLAFNRPDHLSLLIERLRDVRPARVYISVDGPRPDVAGDEEAVAACRSLLDFIDWPASVTTLLHDRNLGCGLGVSTAISWFFEHEERGVILEDDIIPSDDFFPFMAAMLGRYESDPRVFAISGSSFVPAARITSPGAYRFSRYPYVWGWGSWRRSWGTYQLDIRNWRDSLPWSELRRRCGGSRRAALHWSRVFDDCGTGRVDTWDGQLVLASLVQGGLTAVSNANLTTNTGFGSGATHTRREPTFLVPPAPIGSLLEEPVVLADDRADRWTITHQLGATVPRFVVRELRRAKMSAPKTASDGNR